MKRSRTYPLAAGVRSPRALAAALVGAAGLAFAVADATAQDAYFRLVLKHNGRFLDAANCSDAVALHGGSTFAGGACQLWRFVPDGNGWGRLQLKHNAKYLDAVHCSDRVALNAGSDYAGGACQLWRMVPAANGWHRLQLKHNQKYLDAVRCSDEVALHPGSEYDQGACQSWRFVRVPTAAAESAGARPAPPVVRDRPASPAPAPQGPVTRVDDACDSYARWGLKQFRAMQSVDGCRVRPDGRWQGNYDAHYGWCLNASRSARDAEHDAREHWLEQCGATIRH